jgi:hypothetical protein
VDQPFPEVPCLPYDVVRPQIRSGDLLLCSGSGIWSRLIRRATGSVWSHVALLYWVTTMERLMVLESVESRGVQMPPMRQYVTDYNESGAPYPGRMFVARHRACGAMTSGQWRQFGQFALDAQTQRYDNMELGRIAMALVYGDDETDAAGGDPDVRAAKRFICSQFAATCLQAAGIVIPWNPRGYIAPADFVTDPAITLLWEIGTTTRKEAP